MSDIIKDIALQQSAMACRVTQNDSKTSFIKNITSGKHTGMSSPRDIPCSPGNTHILKKSNQMMLNIFKKFFHQHHSHL